MTDRRTSSRRAFFVRGGAVLGAGVATTVGASALAPEGTVRPKDEIGPLREQLAGLADREAIRRLQLAFADCIERQAYEAAAELFDESAHLDLSGVHARGKAAIRQMFASEYREQNAAVIHAAYRQSALQQKDAVTFSEDRRHASATFHVEAEVCTPLQADCTAAQMARLQGQMADRRWETGRFDAKFVKADGQWKIASLSYVAG